jgi:hypothetical protein
MNIQIYRPLPAVCSHQLVLKNLLVWDIRADLGRAVLAGVWQLVGGTNQVVCVNIRDLIFLNFAQF